MGHTVLGVFRHSGDADLAAAHLREEYTLDEDELDIVDESSSLSRPAQGEYGDGVLSAFAGLGLVMGAEDPIGKRWGDQVDQGQTLVVARSDDPERARAIAHEMRVAGADRVDLLPH